MEGMQILMSCALALLITMVDGVSLHHPHVAQLSSDLCAGGAGGPLPNPADCGSFLQCEASGAAAVRPCPPGLEFNAELRVCDFPWRAGCSAQHSGEDSGSSSGSDSSSSSEEDGHGADGDDSSSSSSSEEDEQGEASAEAANTIRRLAPVPKEHAKA